MQRPSTTDALEKLEIERLNAQYIDAFMGADVSWYQDHLAEDFVCIEADGSVLGKTEFLRDAAKGPDVTAYALENVDIRIYGIVAIVRATGRFTRAEGSTGTSRYTDIYARVDGDWKAVCAQITRTVDA